MIGTSSESSSSRYNYNEDALRYILATEELGTVESAVSRTLIKIFDESADFGTSILGEVEVVCSSNRRGKSSEKTITFWWFEFYSHSRGYLHGGERNSCPTVFCRFVEDEDTTSHWPTKLTLEARRQKAKENPFGE